MKLRMCHSVQSRKRMVEKTLGISLSSIGEHAISKDINVHCENCIGGVSVPLGIAGPISIGVHNQKKPFYIPLATTEGALVASVQRGCKAIQESGGVTVVYEEKGVTRGPVFFTGSLKRSNDFKNWILNNETKLKKTAEKTSQHLQYKGVAIQIASPYVFLRFSYDTDLAMGMNMVTIATQAICKYVSEKTGNSCVSLAGNYDIDKKPAWINSLFGRGLSVWAESRIASKTVKNILKTTPRKLYDVWHAKCMIGSAVSGSLGFNAHFANIVAAFYIATGQDPAHTVEGSLGITTIALQEDNSLTCSVHLPAVMLGIVGGGTQIPAQKEALSIIGASDREELACVLAGAVLAGELSLLASLAEGSLAFAHTTLGR